MAKDSDRLASAFETENTGGLLSGLLAEEDEFDRRALWRLGSWGAAAVGAVVVAVMANQSSIGWRRDQLAAADLARQAQQIQAMTKESQNETRRLASAVDTLNGDRDRLYSRVTVLEQGLDSVTGAIARQNSATPQASVSGAKPAATTEAPPPAQSQAAAPAVASVATAVAPSSAAPVTTTVLAKMDPAPKTDAVPKSDKPRTEAAAKEHSPAAPPPALPAASAAPAATQPAPATPLIAAKSILAPPDPAAPKLIEPDKPVVAKAEEPPPADVTASAEKQPDVSDTAKASVQRTEFAVDVGSANSIGGLRALWRGSDQIEFGARRLAPDHRGEGERDRARHAAAAGRGSSYRRCGGGENLRCPDRKRADLRDDRVRRPAPCHEGRRDNRLRPSSLSRRKQHRRNYYPKRAKNDDSPLKPEVLHAVAMVRPRRIQAIKQAISGY